jgi:hypothetical protein
MIQRKKKVRVAYFYRVLSIGCLYAFLIMINGCKKKSEDPQPSKQEEIKSKLIAATWKVQSVTVNGVDKTDIYKNLTLKFTTSNYSSTNGLPVWPSSGGWSFTNGDASVFRGDDGIDVDILEVSATNLKLGLDWNTTTIGSGRVGSVKGDHIFSFVK